MRQSLNIKFICTGNTCRSPMAEGVFRALSRELLPHAKITSAGLAAAAGSPPTDNAAAACAEIGIDISSHRSAPLSHTEILQTDYFFVMTPEHAQALLSLGAAREKIFIPNNISDPYGGGLEVYRRTRDKITAECKRFLSLLKDEFMRIEPLTAETLPYAASAERICFAHPWKEDAMRQRLADENTDFFIAMAGQTPLGYTAMETAADEGYVFNTAVFPDYRGKGVGTALVRRLIKLSEETGLRLLTLEVRAGNLPAISLYKKCGFEKAGERKNYYSDPTENALLMTRFFHKQSPDGER